MIADGQAAGGPDQALAPDGGVAAAGAAGEGGQVDGSATDVAVVARAAIPDLPDGIYFGLSENTYHAQRRIGSTALKHLLTSGPTFWWKSFMNEEFGEAAVEEETEALTSGSALHKIVLEGEEEFHAAYAVLPDKKDMVGLLDTMDDMKGWLTRHKAVFKASSGKAGLIEAIKAHATKNGLPVPPIWEDITNEAKASGKILMKSALYTRCRLTGMSIAANPWLSKCFQDGYPEVSILWTEEREVTDAEGVVHTIKIRCKARIDYLKLRTCVDLKTIANQGAKPLDVSVQNAIGSYRYDVQFAHYATARERARDMVAAGQVFDLTEGRTIKRRIKRDGEWVLIEENMMPPQWWLDDFAARGHIDSTTSEKKQQDLWTWIWVFVQKSGAPESKGYEFRPGGPLTNNVASASRDTALRIYSEHMVKFGAAIWLNVDPIERLTPDHLPQWIRDEGQK